VLHHSPIFSRHNRGQSPPMSFVINGRPYDMGYYLADGIYPDWPVFVKSIRHPMERKTHHFSTAQEGARKDIERAFGVLQARWAVIRGPAYGWKRDRIRDIMMACICMHNMIVEDEQGFETNTNFDRIGVLADLRTRITSERKAFVDTQHKLRNKEAYLQLRQDLIDHIWSEHGSA
jgi:hypothetical protein